MRHFASKLAGAIASFFVALALISTTGQEAKAQMITVVPSPPGCCFDIYVFIPPGGFANWSRVDILRTAGPAIAGVTGVGGVSIANMFAAGTHYNLVSNPAAAFPIGVNTLVGRICLTGGPTTIAFRLQRWNGGAWVSLVFNYILNCGPNGPYIVAGPFKESGYENEDSFGSSGNGMTAAPNPASGQTMLRFETAEALSGSVLSISDVTGREVLRLLDGATLSAGAHEIPVNTEALGNGIYMANLRSENGTIISTKFSVLR